MYILTSLYFADKNHTCTQNTHHITNSSLSLTHISFNGHFFQVKLG